MKKFDIFIYERIIQGQIIQGDSKGTVEGFEQEMHSGRT